MRILTIGLVSYENKILIYEDENKILIYEVRQAVQRSNPLQSAKPTTYVISFTNSISNLTCDYIFISLYQVMGYDYFDTQLVYLWIEWCCQQK